MDFLTSPIQQLFLICGALLVTVLFYRFRTAALLQTGMVAGCLFVTWHIFVAVFSMDFLAYFLQMVQALLLYYLVWIGLWRLLGRYDRSSLNEGGLAVLVPVFILPMTLVLALLCKAVYTLLSAISSAI